MEFDTPVRLPEAERLYRITCGVAPLDGDYASRKTRARVGRRRQGTAPPTCHRYVVARVLPVLEVGRDAFVRYGDLQRLLASLERP